METEFDQYRKNRLEELFNKNSSNSIVRRGYVAAQTHKKKCLLIGLNPSFDGAENSYLYDPLDPENAQHGHYGRFFQLMKGTTYENSWTYLDMLQVREGNSKKISTLLSSNLGLIVELLKLTHKAIEQVQPEIIVVCNSQAVPFFGKEQFAKKENQMVNVWLGYQFDDIDKELGAHIASGRHEESIVHEEAYSLKGVPMIFASTLTYKSRFDIERLKWNIDNVAHRRS